jgi:heavy-metal exporter, HME family
VDPCVRSVSVFCKSRQINPFYRLYSYGLVSDVLYNAAIDACFVVYVFRFLVSASLHNRFLVLILAAVLLIYGVVVIPRLSVDVLPDLNRPVVTIMTEAEGFSPTQVEQRVTLPLENSLNGVSGITRLRSVSGVGLSIVFAEFDWGSDLYRNRQVVAERLTQLQNQLPPRITPQLAPNASIMGEIMLFAITPKGEPAPSPMELRDIADFIVRPQLLSLAGVSNVIPIGGEVRQYRVTPNLDAMRALGVTLTNVEEALARFGTPAGGGFVSSGGSEFLIQSSSQSTLQALQNHVIVVRPERVGGTPRAITLVQVADVGFAPRQKRGDAGYNGAPAVIVSVQKQPNADTLTLTRTVEEALHALQRTLPPAVSITNIQFRQATFIETAMSTLQRVLVEATLVVALILIVFLMNARATVISLTAIPLSMGIALLVFQAMGLSLNTMTLGGLAIAIGELVDDAVVDVENILHRLRDNALLAAPRPKLSVIADASQEVRSGIIYATLIIVLVFVPLFALSGLEGRLFAPLGIAYIVAILGSLLVSLTVTPVLASYLFSSSKQTVREPRLLTTLKSFNAAVLRVSLRIPMLLLTATMAAVIIAGVFAWNLPRTFLPAFNEGSLTVNIFAEPGVSLEESQRLGLIAERLLLNVKDVASVGRRVGRAELDEHAEGVHYQEIDIALKGAQPRHQTEAEVRQALAVLPITAIVGQPISHRIDHLVSGIRAEIAIKVFGENLAQLRRIAERVRGELARVPGLTDVQVERQALIPQVDIRVDAARAAIYGVTPARVLEQVERLSNGTLAARVFEGVRQTDVVLRLSDTARTPMRLADTLIETPQGVVPLRALADVVETETANQILRENSQRRIVVLANRVNDADMTAILADVRPRLESLALPTGYRVVLDGTFRAQEEANRLLLGLSGISFALIFAVLFSKYRSLKTTSIILISVPLAFLGSVSALAIANVPISVASLVGFITLTGIVARNGILKVSNILQLAEANGGIITQEIVIQGSIERLPPVLLTALSAMIALIPLLYDADVPGKEILHPVAVTLFGGLLSATVLDTVLTPALVWRFLGKPTTQK